MEKINIKIDKNSQYFNKKSDYFFKIKNTKVFFWGKLYGLYENNKYINNKYSNFLSKIIFKEKNFNQETIRNIRNILEGYYICLVVSGKNIFIFGDKFNKKELFYYKNKNQLFCSTRLDFIIENLKEIKFNQEALVSMFSVYGNYAPKKDTIYKNVNKLGVDEIIIRKGANFIISKLKYLPLKINLRQKTDDYKKYLENSIKIRSSNEMNWVLLSSGWDSSAILSILVKLRGSNRVRALIAKFKYSNKSGVNNNFEVERAVKIAQHFKVKIDIINIDYSSKEYVRYWSKIKDNLKCNHLYNMNNYNFMKTAEFIKQKSKNKSYPVFNGEISDGAHNLGFSQFATILDHQDLNFREYSDKMMSYLFGPSFFKQILNKTYKNDFIFNILKNKLKIKLESFDNFNLNKKKLLFLNSFFLNSIRFPMSQKNSSKLVTKYGYSSFEKKIHKNYFMEIIKSLKPDNIYSAILYLYNSFHWQGATVRCHPNACEVYNLKCEMPFWDTRIQSYLSSMSEKNGRGLDLNPTKFPLKEAIKNYDYPFNLQSGPHSYLYDIDPNWSADYDILFFSAANKHFKKVLKEKKYKEILDKKYFNISYLDKIVGEYLKGKILVGQERNDLKNLLSISLIGWYY